MGRKHASNATELCTAHVSLFLERRKERLFRCFQIFEQVRQMEAEVVSMTASMLGGGPGGVSHDVCGSMTSGALATRTCLCV